MSGHYSVMRNPRATGARETAKPFARSTEMKPALKSPLFLDARICEALQLLKPRIGRGRVSFDDNTCFTMID